VLARNRTTARTATPIDTRLMRAPRSSLKLGCERERTIYKAAHTVNGLDIEPWRPIFGRVNELLGRYSAIPTVETWVFADANLIDVPQRTVSCRTPRVAGTGFEPATFGL